MPRKDPHPETQTVAVSAERKLQREAYLASLEVDPSKLEAWEGRGREQTGPISKPVGKGQPRDEAGRFVGRKKGAKA